MHIKNNDIDKFYESRKFSHVQKRFYSFIESIKELEKELKKKRINNIYDSILRYYMFSLLYLFIAFIIFIIINSTILKININALFYLRCFFLWLSAGFFGGILTGLIKKEITFSYHGSNEYATKEENPVSYYFILFMYLVLFISSAFMAALCES